MSNEERGAFTPRPKGRGFSATRLTTKINPPLFALLISIILLFGCASSSNSNNQQPNTTKNDSQTVNSAQNNSPAKPPVSGDDYRKCETNADCVPLDCCHSMRCVNSKYAPACEGVVCSADCRSGTMDCGGGCACLSNLCEAIAAR